MPAAFTTSLIDQRDSKGYTILELLVAVSMLAIFLLGVISTYFNTVHSALDSEIIAHTDDAARTILDMMVFDIRMTGSGMPLGQDDFLPGGEDLDDAPLAVLLDSDETLIHFRMNETGAVTMLTADYTPSGTDLSFTVVSTDDIAEDDIIYISDATAGGNDGLQATVSNVAGTTITIDSDYITAESSAFPAGSTVARVMEIEYDSPDDWSGVIRDNGVSEVVLAENTQFEIEYMSSSGEITLPLDETKVADELIGVDITVTAQSAKPLSTGDLYTSEARQAVAIRNL